jgi:hypothetical protein
VNLPHLAPLLFARKVIERGEGFAVVLCEFETLPSLPMFIEAAAQSAAAFDESEEISNGFLVAVKNAERRIDPSVNRYRVKVSKEVEVGAAKRFFFEVLGVSDETTYASGSITMVIEG